MISALNCCKKCGGTESKKDGRCKACAKASLAAWRSSNQEKIRAYRSANRSRDLAKEAEYRLNHPDRCKASQEKFKAAHPERIDAYRARYAKENAAKVQARSKKFYEDNKARLLALSAQWKKNNPQIVKETAARYKEKTRGTPTGRLAHIVSTRIRSSLRAGGYTKKSRAYEILGCDWAFFKQHIERQFEKGMSWDRMGTDIHIDHIIPVAAARTEDEVLKLNHFTNLRPFWAVENIRKSDKRTHLL